MIELLLREHLLADAKLKKIVGKKIYAKVAAQNAKNPFIIFSVINDRDITSLQGDVYLSNVHFQIDCYSASYLKVKELKGAVKEAMYKFKYYPYNFTSRDDHESDTKLHRQLIEFKIKHRN